MRVVWDYTVTSYAFYDLDPSVQASRKWNIQGYTNIPKQSTNGPNPEAERLGFVPEGNLG